MKKLIGRECACKQCYMCTHCQPSKNIIYGSRFCCSFLNNKEFDTWHLDVPTECPCGGRGWEPKKNNKPHNGNNMDDDIKAEIIDILIDHMHLDYAIECTNKIINVFKNKHT